MSCLFQNAVFTGRARVALRRLICPTDRRASVSVLPFNRDRYEYDYSARFVGCAKLTGLQLLLESLLFVLRGDSVIFFTLLCVDSP